MKGYAFLAIGVIWLICAIVVLRTGFAISWRVKHDPATELQMVRFVLYLILFGWIAPSLLGAWLLWRK